MLANATEGIVVILVLLAVAGVLIGAGVLLGRRLKPAVQRLEKQAAQERSRRGERRGPIAGLELPRYRGGAWQDLYALYVPAEGQAATVQGELLRSVTRVVMEYSRNGCLNWSATHIRMCEFARRHLTDGTFSPAVSAFVNTTLDRLLAWAGPPQSPDEEDDGREDWDGGEEAHKLTPHDAEALECLAELWCRAHPQPIPRQADPSLEF